MKPLPRRSREKNPLARLHSPAVMLSLIFLLVIYLVYVLAENYGLEGEGGWLGEVLSAAFFIAGIILAAAIAVSAFLGIRMLVARRRGGSPWLNDNQNGQE